jgi:hypothetical protein
MNKLKILLAIMFISLCVTGCRGKDSSNLEKKVSRTPVETQRALSFLLGMQAGDKAKMYIAANITDEILNESREKLIRASQNRLNEQQKKDSEHALRISGEIEFFSKKMQKIITKSANLQITKSVDKQNFVDHIVKVAYASRDDAPVDKTGKQVKELTLHLLHITRTVGNRQLHEFSFDSKDFEKMAERDFEVLAYF